VTRLVAVPDWGDSGALYQYVELPEPGDPGYPATELPDSDPWAPAINRAIREIAAEASQAGWHPEPKPQPGITPEPAAEVRAAARDCYQQREQDRSEFYHGPGGEPEAADARQPEPEAAP
jgi:hypothetical protein